MYLRYGSVRLWTIPARLHWQTRIFSGKTYHFSLVTEKRQLYVLLVAEDLNLSPLRMDADSQANLFYTIRRLSNISWQVTWYQTRGQWHRISTSTCSTAHVSTSTSFTVYVSISACFTAHAQQHYSIADSRISSCATNGTHGLHRTYLTLTLHCFNIGKAHTRPVCLTVLASSNSKILKYVLKHTRRDLKTCNQLFLQL